MTAASWTRLIAGLALIGLAGLLFTRAGYGPFGDSARRGQPCTASRCPHNAWVLAALGLLLLRGARRRTPR